MGLCKCIRCPQQGNYVVGKYYGWLYAIEEVNNGKKGFRVSDESGSRYRFLPEEYLLYFKDIVMADISMEIYIDRKRDLVFLPAFKHEAGYHVNLDIFEQLSYPYTSEDVGRIFFDMWEEHRNHPIVNAEDVERVTPYYKIITNGKEYKAFSGKRWMIYITFVLSENEIIIEYWYRKKSGFGRDITDKNIDRIVKLSSDNMTVGNAILEVFEEAGVP